MDDQGAAQSGAARSVKAYFSKNPRSYLSPDIAEFYAMTSEARIGVRIVKLRDSVNMDVTADRDTSPENLFEAILEILRFNMLMTGGFLHFQAVRFFDAEGRETEELKRVSDLFRARYSPLYTGEPQQQKREDALLCYPDNRDYQRYLESWIRLRKRLGTGYTMFLTAASGLPLQTEIRFALLAQCFEPLAELLGQRGVITVEIAYYKAKLFSLFSLFGGELFRREYYQGKLEFMTKMVNSRNRMMHLLKKDDVCFTAAEYGIYMEKLLFLYRHILLQMIGVDFGRYRDALNFHAERLDARGGISDAAPANFQKNERA